MSISQLSPCEPERKMWWVVSVLFLVHIASPKPAADDVGTARQSRQLDFGDCCPCPDNAEAFRNQGRWFPQRGKNLEHPGNEGSVNNNGMGLSRSGFDDCPCRPRGADSEGSSSIFFPSALRPSGPLSKSPDSKEDPKNLLEPEVGLASSVLETLRKATDEEYQDALARDAARSRAAEDATPEESAQNITTIILPDASDDEDIISEPSHVQESRCIHPLRSTLSRMSTPVAISPNLLPDFFKAPKTKSIGMLHRNGLNMDSGFAASNIHERIAETNGRNKKNKANPIIMKSVMGDMGDVCDASSRKNPNTKTISLLDRQQGSLQHIALKSSNNPKIMNMKPKEECDHNSDMKSAASGMKELFSVIPNPGLEVSQLVTENDPLNLKNLLKLRDVELIPPGQLIEKLKLGQSAFQIPSLIENMPKLSDLLKNGIKFDLNKNGKWSNAKNNDKSLEDASSSTNIQVIPRDKTFTTQILDALPSTSNINEVQDNSDITHENVRTKPLSVNPTKTEIIESIPNSFHSEDIDDAVVDNGLGQNAKSAEDNCALMQHVNQDDVISNLSQEEQSISDIDSQEEAESHVKSDVSSQNVGTSNCLETIHDEGVFSENRDEILPKDMPNSDMKPLATLKEEDQRRNALNNEKSSSVVNNLKVSPLSHSLKSVKESILRKIDESKRTSKLTKGDKLRELNIEKNTAGSELNNDNQDCDTEPSENVFSMSPKILNTDENNLKSSKGSNTVQLEDLQKLSDSLLRKSMLKEKAVPAVAHNDCYDDIESKTDDRSLEKQLNPKESTVDTNTESNNPHITEIGNPSDFDLMPQSNESDDKDSTCTSSTDIENTPKSLRTGIEVNEMAVEASEPVLDAIHDPLQLFKNTNLGSPLFQNIVVQPSSLFEGLRNPPSLDLGTVLNLPTLDDLRERLANVFGGNDKDTGEDIDCINENPIMSAEPSTSNIISSLPSIPLQDLNLDIFQLKPPTSEKSNTLSKIPGVNLKSFRTKVPVPNNLELKPLKLQSTVGNEGGLLGATLTLGRDSTGIPKLLETLGNPPQNLPSLNEMMTRVRTNVENLVNNPLDLSRNVDPVSRIDDITNTLRTNTENTIRALQGRMGSTLGRPNNLFSNPPEKTEHILERIVDAKEDMEAKLKGLHYDLNDRLTSIHENILDHTRLSSLNSLFEGSSLSRNAFNNNQFNGAKRLHTPASKRLKVENKKETLGKTANLKSKPSSERKINSIVSQRKIKMPAAASVPVPKTIEGPKLKSTLNKHLSSPNNDLKAKLGSSRIKPLNSETNNLPQLSIKHLQEKGAVGKQASSFKEKKVKVTFGSTTSRPISKSQQRQSDFDDTPTGNFRRPVSALGKKLGKQRNDPNESPSEVLPTRLRSPKTSESRNCIENMNSLEDIEEKAPFVKSNRGSMRETIREQDDKTPKIDSIRSGTERKFTNSPMLPFPSLPKIDDNSFLSKVREAVKARLSSFDPKIIGGREAKTCSDMERSASENHNVVVGENLKENVSYKCKMVCTKS